MSFRPREPVLANRGTFSRLVAAALLSVPVSWAVARYDHAKLARWLSEPDVEQTRYIHFLQQLSFGKVLMDFLVAAMLFVLAVEGIAYLLRGKRRSSDAAGGAV